MLQCYDIVSKIKSVDFNGKKSMVVGNNSLQVIETMDVFASKLNSRITIDDRIRGVYLGVANGVSREELRERYPNDALLLDKWQIKEISIKDLNVTDMENVGEFCGRVVDFIQSCANIKNVSTFVVVCTTSVMIMIANFIALGKDFNHESYYHYNVRNGDYIFTNLKGDMTLELLEASMNIDCYCVKKE